MTEADFPHIQLAPMPNNRPFLSFDGGVIYRDTALTDVKQLVEYADQASDAIIEDQADSRTYSYWSSTDGYQVDAARDRTSRLTRVSMTAPNLNPIVWTGLVMLGRKGQLAELRADVIPVNDEVLASGDLWPGPSSSDDWAPVPGAEPAILMDDFEQEFDDDERRTVTGLCTKLPPLRPRIQNLDRESGPGRTLVITGGGTDLQTLARDMTNAYNRLLEKSAITFGYYESTVRVGQMLGAASLHSFNIAWSRGSRPHDRLGRARKVVKELKRLND